MIYLRSRATAEFLGLAAIFGAIWDALKWAAEKAVIIAQAVAQAVVVAGRALGRFAVKVAHWTKDGLDWVKDGFAKLWRNVLRPAWEAVGAALSRAAYWFAWKFDWLIRFIAGAWNVLRFIVDRILVPVLSFLDKAISIARILDKLGIHFFGKVATWLEGVRAKLWELLEIFRSWLNYALGWINYLLNPLGLIRSGILLPSLRPYVHSVLAMMTTDAVGGRNELEGAFFNGRGVGTDPAGRARHALDGRLLQQPDVSNALGDAIKLMTVKV